MKKTSFAVAAIFSIVLFSIPQHSKADLNWGRLIGAGVELIQASSISDEQIQSYVRQYVANLDSKNKVLPPENEQSRRLARLTSGLSSVEGIPLNFKVYDQNVCNAFACADGSVRVYSGLMNVMNDDELLGVIGHEIGHVAHKDTKKSFKQALMTSAAIHGLTSGSSTLAALSDSQLGALGQALIKANYSKKQESNADNYGYEFLKKNGKNPTAMISAFKRLKELEGSDVANMSGFAQMFSSHPDIDKRIRNMEKRAKKDGYL